MEDDFRGTIETNPEMRKIWMELGTGKKRQLIIFFHSQTQTEDIEMRADDVYEGFEDKERGQLRQSRVEVAE